MLFVAKSEDVQRLVDPVDAWELSEFLSPGTAMALLLVEHGWAPQPKPQAPSTPSVH